MAVLRAAAVLFFCILISGCGEEEILVDMVELDRTYIPALALTSSGSDIAQATIAVKEFKMAWATFRAKSTASQYDTPSLRGHFDGIESLVGSADSMVDSGQMKEAHDALEGIRDILKNARQSMGLEYFPDYLSEFHLLVEEMADAAKDGGMDEHEMERMKSEARKAKRMWERIMEKKFSAGLFGFSKAKVKKLKELMEELQEAVVRLDGAVSSGDARGAFDAVEDLRETFSKIYKLFGDFSATGMRPGDRAELAISAQII